MAFLLTQNIIHLDLKPQNIMLTREMVVRIGDFGLSKTISAATTAATLTTRSSNDDFTGTMLLR